MVSFSTIVSAVALISSYSLVEAQKTVMPLPFDGRAQDLTVETITKKYATHILTMRNDSSLTVKDYVTIDQKGRQPAYNGDTGVINIGVDKNAIFKAQTNFRRSELVQFVAANTKGTTFFRTSFFKEEAFLNLYQWQLIFDELHYSEIRVDASVSPPMLIFLCGGTWEPKWNTTFVPGTWYNFGVALSPGSSGKGHEVKFYESEGNEELKLKTTHTFEKDLPEDFEFHFGMLTLSDDGSEPKMNPKKDIVSYNGVTVTADVPAVAGGPACS
ncbi:putative glycoside hydrolase 131, catalytic [Plasmopara halstedii]